MIARLRGVAATAVLLGGLFTLSAGPLASSVAAAGSYSVSGTVTGPDGAALAGIWVTVRRPDSNEMIAGNVTGDDGRYTVSGIESGSYAIAYSDPNNEYAAGYFSDSGLVTNIESATKVTVDGDDVAGINVQLPLGYSISGTVTGPDDAPLSGISVSIRDYGATGAQTEDDGTYTVTGLMAGSYVVTFNDGGGQHASGFYSEAGLTSDQYQASQVAVGPDATGIDVSMPLTAPFTISGTVTDSDGHPLAGIEVEADSHHDQAFAKTGQDGTYSIEVPGGRPYSVDFEDATGTYAMVYYRTGIPGYTAFYSDATAIDGVTVSGSGIDMVMIAGNKVSGTTRNTLGRIVGRINISYCNPTDANDCVWTGNPDGQGHYSVTVIPGSYKLIFSDCRDPSLYGTGFYSASEPGNIADFDTATTIDLTAGDVSGIDVEMPMTGPGHTINGTVTDSDGRPVAGAYIEAGPASGWVDASSTLALSDGTYSDLVLPDSYLVRAVVGDTNYYWSDSGTVTNEADATTVVVGGDDVPNIDITVGYSISGTVTGPGGAPLTNIDVHAEADGNDFHMVTGNDGTYSIPVPPGDYQVYFFDDSSTYVEGCYANGAYSADGKACTKVSAESADATGVDAEMPAGLHISGTVTGPGGTPLANIGVDVRAGVYYFSSATHADGTYSIAVLPGDYTLEFHGGTTYVSGCYANGGSSPDRNACTLVTANPSDATGVDVELLPLTAHISGTITGPGGAPLATSVSISAQMGDYGFITNTAEDGTYSLNVLPGDYQVFFSDSGLTYVDGCYSSGASGNFTSQYVGNHENCTVVATSSSDAPGIDAELPLGLRVSGTVTGPGKAPLGNVWVNIARPGDGTGTSVRTGSDGTYAFGVEPDDYNLYFSDDSHTHVDGCYSVGAEGDFTVDSNACTLVTVAPSGVPPIDVTIPLGAHISGTITGPDGNPVANYGTIHARPKSGGPDFKAQTGADGTYSMTVLPGDYYVQFYDDHSVALNGCYAEGSSGSFTTDFDACTLVTADADAAGIDVRLGYPLGAVDHLVISPGPTTIVPGARRTFTAEGFDVYGNDLGDVTADTTFTVDGGGSCTGTSCTAATVGDHTVTGTDGSAVGTATMNVTGVAPNHLVLTPLSSIVTAGESQSYTAEAVDGDGNSLGDVTGVTSFTISGAGYCANASCTSTVAGDHTVTGTYAGALGTATLHVEAGSLDHLALSPAHATITAGLSQTYTAQGFDAYGNSLGNETSSATFIILGGGSCTVASCTSTVAGDHTVIGYVGTAAAGAILHVDGGPVDHLVLSPATATITAGASKAYAVEGYDAFGNDLGSVTSSTILGIVGGTCDNSAHTCTSTAAGDHTVTATDGSVTTTAALTVSPGAATTLRVSGILNPFPAGSTHSVTVTALDAYGNVAPSYTGTIHFTSSDPKASVPADYKFTASDKGVHTFANSLKPGLTLKTAGAISVTATDKSKATIKGSMTVTVTPGAAKTLVVSGMFNPWPSGSTHSFKVTALDAYGNVATGYTGTIHFTSSDPKAVVPADYKFTAADKGVHTFSNTLKPGLTLKTPGSQWVKATDKSSSTITGSQTVTVK